VILEGDDRILVEQSFCFNFKLINNQTEYEALIAGLKLTRELGIKKVKARKDSQLLASQFNGEYQICNPQLSKYMELVQNLSVKLEEFLVEQILREQNSRAD
jgi:ribonuclease HI